MLHIVFNVLVALGVIAWLMQIGVLRLGVPSGRPCDEGKPAGNGPPAPAPPPPVPQSRIQSVCPGCDPHVWKLVLTPETPGQPYHYVKRAVPLDPTKPAKITD